MSDTKVMPDPSNAPKCPQCGTSLPIGALAGLCPACLLAQGAAADTVTEGKQPPFNPPPVAELGPLFPQLEILELIGKGGMGVVYKARQPKLNRIVALKILAPEKEAEPKFAERFLREAQTLARLNHPNIVTVHDFGETDGLCYLLMEFVDGLTLRQMMREGRMKPEEALAIVPRICEALQFAHEQGIVHRDIKPENVLLDKQGRVKIADFGIAKIMGGTAQETPSPGLTATLSPSDGERAGVRGEGLTQDQILGTPNYMAPEQVEHPQKVDHRADIYSLGVVFYEMLTGELPLGKFQSPSKKVQVDVRLDEVVLRALEKNPELRYQHASVLKTDVETIAGTPDPRSSGRESAQTETGKSESRLTSAATSGGARFSRTAIWGAVWLVFALMAPVQTFLEASGVILPAGSSPPGDGKWLWLLLRIAPPLGYTAAFGMTILGWIAVSQIRRSAGKIYGMWLAVFDGLLFPLLALDTLIGGFWLFVLRVVFLDHRMIPICALLALATMVGVDYLIIRRVWRAVNKPLPDLAPGDRGRESAPTESDRAGESERRLTSAAYVALFFSGMSGILGTLAFFYLPEPPLVLVFSILATAMLGILLATPVRKTRLGKRAMIGGSVSAAIWLIVAAVQFINGWQQTSNTRSQLLQLQQVPVTKQIEQLLQQQQVPVIKQIEQLTREREDASSNRVMSATAAREGDIGVHLDSPGRVESSNSVSFAIPDSYCQDVIRRFNAHQALTVEAFNPQRERFGHGLLAWVADRIDPDTATLKCRASLIPEGENLMVPGQFLIFRLVLEVKHGVTLVPAGAILSDPQGTFVWAIKPDQTVSRRSVQVGTRDSEMGEIQSGLSPGNIVVVGPANTDLHEGQKIRYKLVQTEAKPSASKRLRFVPQEGMADKTSWSFEDKPSWLNPDGWAVFAQMTLGGTASVTLPGANSRCRITLVNGDDSAVTIRIRDEGKKSTMTFRLGRDQPAEMTVDDRGYRVLFPTTEVAADEPRDSSPFATILVTAQKKPDPVVGRDANVGIADTNRTNLGRTEDFMLPFVNDPQVLGEWVSVDFVASPAKFNPDKPSWKDTLLLTGLSFRADGKTSQPWYTWTKGIVFHHGDKTASHYEICEIKGQLYMFFEWKSRTDMIAGKKPGYYVLRKQATKEAP